MKSKLLFCTYDAQLTQLKVQPKCHKTKVTYKLKMYDETLNQNIVKTMVFEGVVAIEFHMNYFDNPIGAEVYGFYEIFSNEEKKSLLERNFIFRKNSFLFHENYDYDKDDPYDLLNYKEIYDDICNHFDQYRLFQQQTTGGIYLILSKSWIVK